MLLDEELTGGDFVRNVKQLIDLLRQVGDVAPHPGDGVRRPLGGRRALPGRGGRLLGRRRVIRKGEEWGSPAGDSEPDLEVTGDDAALATALAGAGPDPLVRFLASPESDLARAVGLTGGSSGGLAVPVDVLRLGSGALAVNAVVIGVPPDRLRWWHRPLPVEVVVDGASVSLRATTVVVTSGQFLRGFDVSPRGHPGDGWCEVQVYRLPAAQRAAMRARLRSGAHLPHPGITVRRARGVVVRSSRPFPVEVDGRKAAVEGAREVAVSVVPAAFRLLV